MPVYQFTAPAGSPTLQHRADRCPRDQGPHRGHRRSWEIRALPVRRGGRGKHLRSRRGGGLSSHGRIWARQQDQGLTAAPTREGWSETTGEPVRDLALFLHDAPGANVMEDGEVLPEVAR